jgi:hypothetical protein
LRVLTRVVLPEVQICRAQVRETEEEMRVLLREMDKMKQAHTDKLAQLSDVFKQVYPSK